MKHLLLIMSVLALTACSRGEMEGTTTVDQCLRSQLFNQCMRVVPAGPIATKYNDWDEVVSECGSQSRMQSIRKREFVKPECRSD